MSRRVATPINVPSNAPKRARISSNIAGSSSTVVPSSSSLFSAPVPAPAPQPLSEIPSTVSESAVARPSLVVLGSSNSQSPVPHHKKFSSSNINKKFLEKNTTSGSAASSATSSAAKSGAPSGQCHLSIKQLYVFSRLTLIQF